MLVTSGAESLLVFVSPVRSPLNVSGCTCIGDEYSGGSGGGETNTSNDSAPDVTSIDVVPPTFLSQ